MKDLLNAIDEFLVAQDIYDRQRTEQTRKLRGFKRQVLNHVRLKYQKIMEQQAAQLPLTAAKEAG
jgi:hypothetical protein